MGLLPDTYDFGLRMRRECRKRFPRHRLVSDPGIHHGTCVTHVPWCISWSLTRVGGENVPGIPGACATRNFTYLARGPGHIHNGVDKIVTVMTINITISTAKAEKYIWCYHLLQIHSGWCGPQARSRDTFVNKETFLLTWTRRWSLLIIQKNVFIIVDLTRTVNMSLSTLPLW